MRRLLVSVLALISSAGAVEPDEARARALSREIRCVVCQSESIDDSNAPLARDLRIIIRERISAGDNDRQVTDYLVERYGDYVLLKPRMKANTFALWLAPAAAGLVGATALVLFLRKRRRDERPAPLTPAERAAIARLDE